MYHAKQIRQWLAGKRVLRACTIAGRFRQSVFERIVDETWAKYRATKGARG